MGAPLAAPSSPLPIPITYPPSPITRHFLGFVRLLRERGLAVSPAEAADALRAVAAFPALLAERAAFEATLAGTLVKCSCDLPAFAALFTDYFLPEPAHAAGHGHEHAHRDEHASVVGIDVAAEPETAAGGGPERHEHGPRIDLRRFFGAGSATDGHDHHAADRLRLTWLGRDVRLDRTGAPPALAALDGGFSLRRLLTVGVPGGLRPEASVELPRDVVLRGVADHWHAAGTEMEPDLLAWIEEAIASGAITRRRDVEDNGRSTLAPGWDARDGLLPDLAWDALSQADLARLERAVARMGRKLGGTPGRRRPGHQGRLDAAATMRRAMSTGGVPFQPVFRRRAPDRPRLVVFCDASLSVRGAARFLLQVSRAAQRQTGRVRTFVFVRDVAEVTHVLQRGDLAAAVAVVFDGRLLDTSEASDAGAALTAFLTRFGGSLTPRTTVLILGDGRNNGRDPNVAALAEIRARCRRLIWLSPEARASWRLGGCDLAAYAPSCDVLEAVRTPTDLERVMGGG